MTTYVKNSGTISIRVTLINSAAYSIWQVSDALDTLWIRLRFKGSVLQIRRTSIGRLQTKFGPSCRQRKLNIAIRTSRP